jgi:hypothetical protein
VFFAKKPKAAPTPQERAAEYRLRIADAIADAQAGGVDIYTLVGELSQSAEALRRQWAYTAPLGKRLP